MAMGEALTGIVEVLLLLPLHRARDAGDTRKANATHARTHAGPREVPLERAGGADDKPETDTRRRVAQRADSMAVAGAADRGEWQGHEAEGNEAGCMAGDTQSEGGSGGGVEGCGGAAEDRGQVRREQVGDVASEDRGGAADVLRYIDRQTQTQAQAQRQRQTHTRVRSEEEQHILRRCGVLVCSRAGGHVCVCVRERECVCVCVAYTSHIATIYPLRSRSLSLEGREFDYEAANYTFEPP